MRSKESLQLNLVDMHCHILPGLDDGSKDMDESISMLRCAAESGTRAIIATPHYKKGRHNAGADTIKSRIEMLSEAAKSNDCPISFYPGNEILYFDGLADALTHQKVLTLNETNRVLIEFSPLEQFTYIRNALDEIIAIGYVPVLAHVERYQCIVDNLKYAWELVKIGVELQVNAGSVVGNYGRKVKRFVLNLIAGKLITYIGSDAHDKSKRTPDMEKCYRKLIKKFDSDYIVDIMKRNAEMLINM